VNDLDFDGLFQDKEIIAINIRKSILGPYYLPINNRAAQEIMDQMGE
jgi:hypothetical protein